MKILKKIIIISRPRFWLYLAGPVMIGAAAVGDINIFFNSWFYILFFYFLLPANLYLYGINDYFDYDTDQFNLKKEGKESRLKDKRVKKIIKIYLIVFLIFSFILIIFLPKNIQALFLLFIFLATFYSAPPLRFKKRPIIDSTSNILYIIPGFIVYNLFTVDNISLLIIISLWSWAIAMHLFSAILDIEPDKKAKLRTTAILLGHNLSLFFCFLLWFIFATLIIYKELLYPFSILFLVYPLISFYIFIGKKNIVKYYWRFPYITAILGFLTFWYLIYLQLF